MQQCTDDSLFQVLQYVSFVSNPQTIFVFGDYKLNHNQIKLMLLCTYDWLVWWSNNYFQKKTRSMRRLSSYFSKGSVTIDILSKMCLGLPSTYAWLHMVKWNSYDDQKMSQALIRGIYNCNNTVANSYHTSVPTKQVTYKINDIKIFTIIEWNSHDILIAWSGHQWW